MDQLDKYHTFAHDTLRDHLIGWDMKQKSDSKITIFKKKTKHGFAQVLKFETYIDYGILYIYRVSYSLNNGSIQGKRYSQTMAISLSKPMDMVETEITFAIKRMLKVV